MKIKFNKKDFLKAIKIGGCFASKRTPLPILRCIKVTVTDNSCWILSYDEQNAIKTNFGLENHYDLIDFCIEKDDIERYVSLLSEDYFELDINNESLTAVASTSDSTMTFPLFNVDEFPSLAVEVQSDTFELDAGLFGYWVQKASPFLDTDEFQLNHEHLHFFIKDKTLDVFAFNFDKMYHDSSFVEFDGEIKMSINRSSFMGLRNALSNETKVTVKNGEKNIVVIGDNTMLLIRKHEFNPLDFYMLLKYKPLFEVEVDKERLTSVVLRAMNVHDDTKTGTLTINFDENGLTLVSERPEVKKKLKETIQATGAKEFKQTYILSKLILALNAISSDKVVLRPCGTNALFEIGNTEYTTESGYVSPCRD